MIECSACGERHEDWIDRGTKTIDGLHHEGKIQIIECGHCGNKEEVGTE